MLRHDHPGIGNLIQGLSAKVDDLQREMAGLRQDVRTLTFLVREGRSQPDEQQQPVEQDANEDTDQGEA